MMDTVEIIRRVQCCVCNGSLVGGHLNFVTVCRKPTWSFPVSSNVLTDWGPAAIAILCDACVERPGVTIARVVEFRGPEVLYHAVEQLEELPPEPTYHMVTGRDGRPGIHCLRCGMTSQHPDDIDRLYCAICDDFHTRIPTRRE